MLPVQDLCDATNRSTAFSYISLSWGTGCTCPRHTSRRHVAYWFPLIFLSLLFELFAAILGPFIGGVLSQPVLKFPSLFSSDGLFGRFPYALQGMAIGGGLLISFVITLLFLPESLHMAKPQSYELLLTEYVLCRTLVVSQIVDVTFRKDRKNHQARRRTTTTTTTTKTTTQL